MAYILVSDLLARFGAEEIAQISDRATPRLVTADLLTAAAAGSDLSSWSSDQRTAAAAALAIVQSAIDDAQSEVDSYLAGRYSTPLATPPEVIKRLTADIVRYCLADDHAPEAVQKRYDAGGTFLRSIASGKITLGVEAQTPAPSGGIVEMWSSGRVFDRTRRGL